MDQDNKQPIGTVISDEDAKTPSFERIHIKLKAGQDVKPGALVRTPASARADGGTLIARVSKNWERNPHETVQVAAARDGTGITAMYAREEQSTTIYRVAEAEIIEEIVGGETRAPESLPVSGEEVFFANQGEVALSLGLMTSNDAAGKSLFLGHAIGGTTTPIHLKREAIQRHFFIGGTTGSGKSYAMGVLAEELIGHNLPVVFIDTQDEYSILVEKLKGKVVVPGKDFHISISSLTPSEFLDLLPKSLKSSTLQTDIAMDAFASVENKRKEDGLGFFSDEDLIGEIPAAAKNWAEKSPEVRAKSVTTRIQNILHRQKVFGAKRDSWHELLKSPCLAINCKALNASQLQWVTTAVLRDLQNHRLAGKIPPYVAVVDEAHLFVPEGQESPCKQIIREGVRIGRHHGICMVLMTQSPVDIDKRAIRQCNTRMVFALEPDQLDAIRGVRADASDEMLRALPKMPRGTCVLSGTYESVKHAVTVKIRERKTQNSEGGEAPDIFAEMQKKLADDLKRKERKGVS